MPQFTTYWSELTDGTLSDAGKVGITDTSGAYTSTNVDGALDEIANGTTLDGRYDRYPILKSALVYQPAIGQIEAIRTPAEATLYFVPWPHSGWTVANLYLRVTGTAGSSGCVARFGIYASASGQHYPGDLIAEADSTVAATSTNNTLTATFTDCDVPGPLSWLAVAIQGGAATRPTVQSCQGNNPYIGGAGNTATSCYAEGSVSVALPSTAAVPGFSSVSFWAPNIGVAVSAAL